MNSKFIAIGIAGALIYISMEGMVKNKALNTGLMAVGAVMAAKQIPMVNTYL